LFEPLGMTASSWSGGAEDKVFVYTWSSSVRDMSRVGLLLLNRGMWNGKRVLAEEWVYKMTHPAFEDGNTGYGYLTWLSSWSNHSIGFSPPTTQGANVPCTPVALWDEYPHGELSTAPDCNYESPYACDREEDVGVFQAVGLGGQLIQVHPGLDLVIAVRNEPLGGAGAWPALRPAVVNADPMFDGNDAAFCEAYQANTYAPDLKGPWRSIP
jgi:CubicO group peptidase (beta-lactamase class C family)